MEKAALWGLESPPRPYDGSESFSLEAYVAGGALVLYKGAFDRAYGYSPPNVISASVQPANYSGVLKQRR